MKKRQSRTKARRERRNRRLMMAYIMLGIIVALVTLMIVLMVCGVLYIKERFAPVPDSEPPAESGLIDDTTFSEPPIIPAAPSVPGEVVIYPRSGNGTG